QLGDLRLGEPDGLAVEPDLQPRAAIVGAVEQELAAGCWSAGVGHLTALARRSASGMRSSRWPRIGSEAPGARIHKVPRTTTSARRHRPGSLRASSCGVAQRLAVDVSVFGEL